MTLRMPPATRALAAMVALVLPVAGCGALGPDPLADLPLDAEEMRALPGVVEAEVGEFEASDGEITQTISVAVLDQDVDSDDAAVAAEAVAGSGADFWAVYVAPVDLDPEYADEIDPVSFDDGVPTGLVSDEFDASLGAPEDVMVELLETREEVRSMGFGVSTTAYVGDDGPVLLVMLLRADDEDVAEVSAALGTESDSGLAREVRASR